MKGLLAKMDEKFDNFSKGYVAVQFSNSDRGKEQSSGDSILGSLNQGFSGVNPLHQYQDSPRKKNHHRWYKFHNPVPKIEFHRFDGSKPRS